MTITKKTTLKCDYCGKEESFLGETPQFLTPYKISQDIEIPESPIGWYKVEPNYEKSIWYPYQFRILGDLCSLECLQGYINKKVWERNNPEEVLFEMGVK